jgi:5-hydroxyisourate hydrolase
MKAGGISIHAVDVARGVPAAGMRVELYALQPERRLLADGCLGADGLLDHPMTRGDGIAAGPYEAVFHIGAYLAESGGPAGFLDEVPFRFVVSRAEEHYHLPLKFTPFGYALFRGS